MPSRWDQLRAALIVAHLALITVAAVPAPNPGIEKQRKNDPAAIEAMAPWARLLVTLGLAEDEADGREWLFERGGQLTRARFAVLGKGNLYLKLTGNSQSWRMFGAAPVRHGRLEVHGRIQGDDEWIPLFVDSNPRHQWGARVLNHNRARSLRSNFSDHSMRRGYMHFARWLAARAFEDHPELVSVRVRLQGLTVPPPKVLREKGRLTLTKVFWPVQFQPEDVR